MKNLFFLLLLAFSMSVNAQVGINTDNSTPDPSAMLDVKSTDKGALLPRMSTDQRNTIISPAEGLVIYNTNEKALNIYNGTAWASMMPVPAFECGLSITVNHLVSRGVAPVNKTVVYETVTGVPGEPSKCWITSNLGASHQATEVSDATEVSAGWYWQFNRKQGYKHDGITRTPNTAWDPTNDNLSATWEAAKDPCTIELGAGWRIPTNTEWTNVDGATGGNWTNWNHPFVSALKLHAAGYLGNTNGLLNYEGQKGNYWSSTQAAATFSYFLDFNYSVSNMSYSNKAYGYSVRCVRDL